MKTKSILSLILMTFVMLFSINVHAATQITSGDLSCSTGELTWTLTDDGVLKISGTGTLDTDYRDSSIPWSQYKQQIISVDTRYATISYDGDLNMSVFFNNCPNLTSIDLSGVDCNISKNTWSKMLNESPNVKTIKANAGFVLPNVTDKYVWQIGNTIVQADGEYAIKSTQTITKKARYYTINYETNGGVFESTTDTYDILTGLTFEKYGSISNGNKHFAGWYADPDFEISVGDLRFHMITEGLEETGIILYALWEEYDENDIVEYRGTIFCEDEKTLEWSLSKQGVLVVTGEGVTDETFGDKEEEIPWTPYKEKITKAFINQGTVKIKNVSNLFTNCPNLTQVDVSGLESINTVGMQQIINNSNNVVKFTAGEGFKLPTIDKQYVWASSEYVYAGEIENTLYKTTTVEKKNRYYKINYILNDGSFTGDYSNTIFDKYTGLTAEMLTTPIRTSYTFDGWFIDADCTIPFTVANIDCFEDITVYAKWTHIFDDDHGMGYVPLKPIIISPDPQKTDEHLTSLKIANAKKAKVTSIKIKKNKNTVKLTFKKTKGYSVQIKYSLTKNFKRNCKTKTTSKNSYTIKNLKRGKTYYVKMRTYKVIDGQKVYGSWSKVKTFKLKSIKKTSSAKSSTKVTYLN